MSDALISDCGTYRYTLGRCLLDAPSRMTHRQIQTILPDGPDTMDTPENRQRAHKPCLFVMLNPSTADASLDDPTIRRCIGFAKREGCTFLTVINLFAYRATDPDDLVVAHKRGVDVWGPEHYTHFQRELRRHNVSLGHLIVAGWGSHPMARVGCHHLREALQNCGASCLGTTKDGEPRHPLYLRADAPLVPWKSAP